MEIFDNIDFGNNEISRKQKLGNMINKYFEGLPYYFFMPYLEDQDIISQTDLIIYITHLFLTKIENDPQMDIFFDDPFPTFKEQFEEEYAVIIAYIVLQYKKCGGFNFIGSYVLFECGLQNTYISPQDYTRDEFQEVLKKIYDEFLRLNDIYKFEDM